MKEKYISMFNLLAYKYHKDPCFNSKCFYINLQLAIYIYIYIYKWRERKVKTLTRNWRDHWRTGTHKHTETVSRYFDRHGHLYQSEESKCLWTHDKDGVIESLRKVPPCLSKYLNTVSMCLCVPVLLWFLQFLVRVFTFLSLNLWFPCVCVCSFSLFLLFIQKWFFC